MLKNRWFKNTLGVAAECIIAQALDTSNTSAPQATFDAFVTTAPAGSISVFWTDTKGLVANSSSNAAANQNRTLFYAWKQADGTVMVSTPIPAVLKYTSVAYNAGQPDILSGAFGGTISVGQTINVSILETTAVAIPFPKYQYNAKVKDTVANALLDIATQINNEKADRVASASSSGTTLTITGLFNNRTIKAIASIDVTVAQPTDASAIVWTVTQKAVAPVGTTADVKEFENYFLVQNGAILRADDMVLVSEFQTQASNVVSGINYGYLIVTSNKSEKGEVKNFNHKSYVIIAAPAAAISALAAK